MSEDVPDYMSSVFLVEVEPSKDEKRLRRMVNKNKAHREKNRSPQEIQNENLEQGVNDLNPRNFTFRFDETDRFLKHRCAIRNFTHTMNLSTHWLLFCSYNLRISIVDENGIQEGRRDRKK
eukprot:TRINITY_DN3733_c0_g1_i9.p1 TRINITY_DN3733_c0_g1~~TRINITY_DN3733_c0_g1_i9.p1  ORF type:complete len:121 (-),score=22.42 TRINITY_DN3733_c0_g1_i9:161-523(-)